MKSAFSARPWALAGLGLLLLAAPALHAHGDDAMGKDWLEHMKKDLQLSDTQYSQVKDEVKADKDACKTQQDKMALDVDTLKVLVDKKASDDELTPAIATLKADYKDKQAQMATHMEAMQAILTPLQQAKEVIKMCEMKKPGMGGHAMMEKHKMDGDKDEAKDAKDDKDDK
jgi:Spy/CpxP family protein refolding chaperone